MFKHYLYISWRNLFRNKYQTIFTIVGLAVAFFCFGFCMYFVRGYLTMDTYFDNHERVYALTGDRATRGISLEAIQQLQAQFPEVEAVIRVNGDRHQYKHDEVMYMMDNLECDTTLRAIYNPRLIAGSWSAAQHSNNSLLLCESFARKVFGTPEKAIGEQFSMPYHKRLDMDGHDYPVYTVQAVVEDLPFNNTFLRWQEATGWIMNDIESYLVNPAADNNYLWWTTRVMLREGTDLQSFKDRLNQANINSGVFGRSMEGEEIQYPLSVGLSFDTEREFLNNGVFFFLLVLITLPGLLILLSALSNFFHLLLSAIMMRRREYTLRRAHGAHTWDLWFMVSTQVVIMMLLVGFCTLIIVELFAPMVNVTDQLHVDAKEMLHQSMEYIVLMLLIGLLISWLAVARIRKDSLQEAMKTSTGRRPGRHIGRNILLGWQMVIGLLFLTALGALIMQLKTNENALLPWLNDQTKREIVQLPGNMPGMLHKAGLGLESELQAIPSVQSIATEPYHLFGEQRDGGLIRFEYEEGGDTITCHFMTHDPRICQLLDVQLLKGRMPENEMELLMDETMESQGRLHLGDRIKIDPQGGTMWSNYDGEMITQYYTVVGVIDNLGIATVNNSYSWSRNLGYIYRPWDARYNSFIYCRSYPGKAEEMKAAIEQVLIRRGLCQAATGVSFSTAYAEIQAQNSGYTLVAGLFWLFAAIAMTITLLGVYSAITMDTTARRKEMAIRKINGAKTHQIAMRFCRLYLVLLSVAALVVFPVGYILLDTFCNNSFRVSFDNGVLFYLSMFLIMTAFVALTIGVQVWRIARINPAKIVKAE